MTPAVTGADRGHRCIVRSKRVNTSIEPAELTELFSMLDGCSILGGNSAVAGAGRFSYWAANPRHVFEFRAGGGNPLSELQELLSTVRMPGDRSFRLTEADSPVMTPEPQQALFCGGWIGYFGYELAGYIECLPATAVDDLGLPLIRLCFYDRVIAYDHLTQELRLIALELPEDRQGPWEKIAELEYLVKSARTIHVAKPHAGKPRRVETEPIRCNMDKDYYLHAVDKIKRYILDGDVYQVNLSRRLECDYKGRPVDLYHWQNEYNPCGYAAYLDCGRFQIVSASPELFVRIRDGLIWTKPIKGTRPRIAGIESDQHAGATNARNYQELLRSPKEQAELNMITDLERNDLARICVPGTRTVVQPRTIEAYPTVFHAVATVGGRLREDVGFCDVLRAMFPGGSITGAPKIRAMEIIDETEPTARGIYTGSIGYVGIDGSVCLNIAIRTVIIAGSRAFVQTGGGIVADSQPEQEWEETVIKAQALVQGIAAVQRQGVPCTPIR